jgi:hypothetical protein
MTPRHEGRYEVVSTPKVTLASLDDRISNVERILLAMHAQQTPKWVKLGGWTSVVGAALGVAVKVLLG